MCFSVANLIGQLFAEDGVAVAHYRQSLHQVFQFTYIAWPEVTDQQSKALFVKVHGVGIMFYAEMTQEQRDVVASLT